MMWFFQNVISLPGPSDIHSRFSASGSQNDSSLWTAERQVMYNWISYFYCCSTDFIQAAHVLHLLLLGENVCNLLKKLKRPWFCVFTEHMSGRTHWIICSDLMSARGSSPSLITPMLSLVAQLKFVFKWYLPEKHPALLGEHRKTGSPALGNLFQRFIVFYPKQEPLYFQNMNTSGLISQPLVFGSAKFSSRLALHFFFMGNFFFTNTL